MEAFRRAWIKLKQSFSPAVKYPKRLLPRRHYRIMDCGGGGFGERYLVRHVDMDDKAMYVYGCDGKLTPDVIDKLPSSQLTDLSTNLLGTYQLNDLYISFLKTGKDDFIRYWKEGEKVETPLYSQDFEFKSGRKHISWNISHLCRASFLYEYSGTGVNLCFCIVHSPTVSNFWHFSVHVVSVDGKNASDLGLSDGQKKRYYKTAKNMLVGLCHEEIPPQSEIRKEYYSRN